MSRFGGSYNSANYVQNVSTPVAPGLTLESLKDVSITSNTNNDTVVYNGTASAWTNVQFCLANLGDVSGVNATSGGSSGVTNGQVLQYNSTNSAWEPVNFTLADLGDATISSPSNNQLLQYNSSASKWENATVTPSSALASLTDCTISTPSNNQLLQYNSSASKWENATVTLSSALASLTDCTISSPSNNQLLQYNSSASKWENATVTLSSALASLTDCSILSPSNGQILQYNSTTSLWQNTTISLGSMSLSGDSDVSISGAQQNQILQYNASTSKWVNQNPVLNGKLVYIVSASSSYTVTKDSNNYVLSSYILVNNTLSSTYAITLPATPQQNTRVLVKDISGTANTYNITVSASGSDSITNGTISVNNACFAYVYSSTTWTGTETTSD
jgi:hypothetical protein